MKTNPESIIDMAQLSGVPIDVETAQRILRFVGPAIATFSPTSAALPLDCEPAAFIAVQRSKGEA